MTNATKHTPTPWDHINGVYTQENGYFSMVQTPDKCVADVFDKEDAAHIVKCVNMHDELVGVPLSALNELEEHEKWSHENDVCITTNLDIIKRIKSITSNFEG